MYAFPWAVPGTALADEQGPEPWQRDILERLGEGLISTEEAVRAAVASGHGVGKSALVSWIVLWALSTVRDTRGIVTAILRGRVTPPLGGAAYRVRSAAVWMVPRSGIPRVHTRTASRRNQWRSEVAAGACPRR